MITNQVLPEHDQKYLSSDKQLLLHITISHKQIKRENYSITNSIPHLVNRVVTRSSLEREV